jgi:hypothetical protein
MDPLEMGAESCKHRDPRLLVRGESPQCMFVQARLQHNWEFAVAELGESDARRFLW